MARNHVRWQFGVWRKPEHRETGKDARLLYMTICGDEALNQAGVVVLRPSAWAEDAGMTEDEADAALHELVERRFVVVDWHTRDLLVRTFIRNDGVADQPNVLRSALKIAANVRSDLVKKVLADELRKLPAKPADKVLPSGKAFSYPDPHAVADEIDPGDVEPPNPPRKSSANPSGEPFGEPHGVGEGVGERSNGSSRSSGFSSSEAETASDQKKPAKPPRPDVEALCTHLADRIAEDGSKRPSIGQGWLDAARRMIDLDGRDPEKAHRLIDWCQDDEFWRGNILSMPTFRDKYDQLRKKANEQRGKRSRKQQTSDVVRSGVALVRKYEAEEAEQERYASVTQLSIAGTG